MSNWKIQKLTDCISNVVDNRGKTAPTAASGIPLIATNCIKEHGLFPVYEKLRYVSEETYKNWFRGHPKPNDIIFVNKGNAGFVCLTPDPVGFCIAQDMVAIRAKEEIVTWKYLFAYLRTLEFKRQVDSLNVGTTIPHLKKSTFGLLSIPVPTKKEQEIIGNFYYDLSAKIELNRRMNQTLEQMAQTLFRQYFVDDIDEENLPEGWYEGKLNEVLELVYGKALKQGDRKGGDYPVVGSSGIVGYHNSFIAEGKGIVVGRKGNAGAVIWIDQKFYPIDTTYYVVDQLQIEDLYFHYFLLKSLPLAGMNSDSAVPGLNRNEAHNINILIPSRESIIDFNNKVRPLFDQKYTKEKEIATLTQLRDTLLPKLMSGEFDVMQIKPSALYEPVLS